MVAQGTESIGERRILPAFFLSVDTKVDSSPAIMPAAARLARTLCLCSRALARSGTLNQPAGNRQSVSHLQFPTMDHRNPPRPQPRVDGGDAQQRLVPQRQQEVVSDAAHRTRR